MLQLSKKWQATYRDAWPDALVEFAPPADLIALGHDDMLLLGSATPSFCGRYDLAGFIKDTPAFLPALETMIGDTLPQGAFLRLSSVSFKKPEVAQTPCFDIEDAMNVMCSPNERVAAFITDAIEEEYPLSLVVSPWVDIPKWSEFRLFIRDGVLVGLSQYWWDRSFPEIHQHHEAIRASILAFLDEFLPKLHLPTVIVDVSVQTGTDGIGATSLIELNPFIRRADACLFSWDNGGDFDGSFRFVS